MNHLIRKLTTRTYQMAGARSAPFIIRRQFGLGAGSSQISERDFIQGVLRFQTIKLSNQDILNGVQSISNAKSLVSCQGKLFIQLNKRDKSVISEVKKSMFNKALEIFNGEDFNPKDSEFYRGFLQTALTKRIFSPNQMRLFIEQTLIGDKNSEKNSGILLQKLNYNSLPSILESCIYNRMISNDEVLTITRQAVVKLHPISQPFDELNKIVLALAFQLKKGGNLSQEIESCFNLLQKSYLSKIDKARGFHVFQVLQYTNHIYSLSMLYPFFELCFEGVRIAFYSFLQNVSNKISFILLVI